MQTFIRMVPHWMDYRKPLSFKNVEKCLQMWKQAVSHGYPSEWVTCVVQRKPMSHADDVLVHGRTGDTLQLDTSISAPKNVRPATDMDKSLFISYLRSSYPLESRYHAQSARSMTVTIVSIVLPQSPSAYGIHTNRAILSQIQTSFMRRYFETIEHWCLIYIVPSVQRRSSSVRFVPMLILDVMSHRFRFEMHVLRGTNLVKGIYDRENLAFNNR